jgi:hypothetical protein
MICTFYATGTECVAQLVNAVCKPQVGISSSSMEYPVRLKCNPQEGDSPQCGCSSNGTREFINHHHSFMDIVSEEKRP